MKVVWSHTEWDPLEEVIVGHVRGAAVPPWHISLAATVPTDSWPLLEELGGTPAPEEFVEPAHRQLEGLVEVFESFGVTVRRPDPIPQTEPFSTPDWSVEAGYSLANPRDLLLVVGDEIIETPCAWRSRALELNAFRSLLHEYFRAGARWTAAPRPRLADTFYDADYTVPEKGQSPRYVINESECTFDAADFVRCGRDLFGVKSNVTNDFGIEWLRRHLGNEYRIHLISSLACQPMHIDTTFVPLAPGKALINPEFFDRERMPAVLGEWELREAPVPVIDYDAPIDLSSDWLTMNVVSVDETHVIVDAAQRELIDMLRGWGFDPVPVPFQAYYPFGGGFHCATLDVRRRGALESYFSA